ncbi:exosortase/archaeosortase family protein [Desulfofustis glycolicus]|uniref:Exosortase A n=1 Tax=Desulfofustis glycolicus DSM 9705 TaxID=1121409 RepID=A0A1M5YUM7_9BACT|nr:exosortase/archaeosortase family protein [Desulfofustis glycolicus]SHI15731.1 exosortase A [Desulfofustis glycolicus DSM 9705]
MMIQYFLPDKRDRTFWVALVALFLAFLFVFMPVWKSLFIAWSTSDDYSHGFFIVPLSLYIVWQKRHELADTTKKSSWIYFPLVILTLALYLGARYAEIISLAPVAMILFLGASIIFMFGWHVFRVCAFPLFLLFFMIPVPGQIYANLTIPLQLFVTKIAVFLVSLINIPIHNQGNVIYLTDHTLEVVQACSGLRSIMTLLTVGAIVAYFGLTGFILRVILFFSAIPIAIMLNVLRVLLIIFSFHYFNFDLTEGVVHTITGVAVFIFSLILFLLFRNILLVCEK